MIFKNMGVSERANHGFALSEDLKIRRFTTHRNLISLKGQENELLFALPTALKMGR